MKYLLFGIFCCCSFYLSAQALNPDRTFEKGKELFIQGNYASAARILKELSDHDLKEPYYREETAYMLASSAYQLKDSHSMELMRRFVDKYPYSPRTNRVYAWMASACFFEKRYKEAIALFTHCCLAELSDAERDASTLHLAISYLEIGSLSQASVWLRTLKESSRSYRPAAIYNLSYIDYLQGRYDAALTGFLSLQDDPEYAQTVPYYLAEIYLLKKNYDKSQIVAQNYLSAYPANRQVPAMQRILGESEYGLGQYSQAIESLTNYVHDTSSPERSVLYQLGMSYYHTRVFSQAAETLERITGVKDALSQNAYLHTGLAYLQLKEKNKARMAFSQAASSDFNPEVKEQALYNYALCIHETAYSPFDESVKVFERFLNEFPRSSYSENVSRYLVEVYLNTRSYQVALASIDKIAHPDSRILQAKQKILFRLGTQAFVNGRYQESARYFDRSLELSRYDRQTKADAYYWLGEACFRLNRYTDATRNFRLYLDYTEDRENETYALAYYNLGYAAFKQKNYSSALAYFQQYINRSKSDQAKLRADALNRMGDCYFYARNFGEAYQSYLKAAGADPSLGDYSLYQAAFVRGLQKDYAGKIRLLEQLASQYPQSSYMDDALYEKGRAYVQTEDTPRAIETFRRLLDNFPESVAARKGANEIGLLYYQADDYPRAIESYKKVMVAYPGSEEAVLAQRDLKSIYLDLNRIDEYAEFITKTPGGFALDKNEKDSLTYAAAERIYMRGDQAASRGAFEKYLREFPQGSFHIDARYHLGLMDYQHKKFPDALRHFQALMQYPDNRFAEDVLAMSAEIQTASKNYAESLSLYQQLKDKASSAEKKQLAKTGILRSARLSGNDRETVLAASDLLADVKLTPELANEAKYDRAKAHLSLNAPQSALPDLKELSKDTRNAYGAEARYLLARLYFEAGETALAEKEVLDYIDESTPHAYWLARSFILLSDIYLKTGKKSDARQYLISLQENYHAKDDIAGMIDLRLKQLSK